MAKKLILFGIKSDAETIGRLFEEFKKRGAERRKKQNYARVFCQKRE